MTTVEQEIRTFLVENFSLGGDINRLPGNRSLTERGIIDSVGIVEVLTFLETQYDISINDDGRRQAQALAHRLSAVRFDRVITSPLFRAHRLERALGTPARIYYKYEGVSPAGSHKPNTAVPQAYYNAKAGIRKLTTETGAGQWGTALAFACALFDVDCEVWQVGASYDSKPYRGATGGEPIGGYATA